MRPYSNDLRERVAAAVEHGEGSQREIARRFRVSLSFVVRLLQRRRGADTLEPRPHGGCPPPALGPGDRRRLDELIRARPDATLGQLRQLGGFTCSLMTLWRALRRRDLTRKEKTMHAGERDRPDVQAERRSFRREVKRIEPERLIFVDEAGVTTAMTPAYAWAPRGERAYLGPRFVGVGDRDRGPGTGRGSRPAGVPGVDERGGLPGVRQRGVGAGSVIPPGIPDEPLSFQAPDPPRPRRLTARGRPLLILVGSTATSSSGESSQNCLTSLWNDTAASHCSVMLILSNHTAYETTNVSLTILG
jgi:transposase